jgi:hypothetical protein
LLIADSQQILSYFSPDGAGGGKRRLSRLAIASFVCSGMSVTAMLSDGVVARLLYAGARGRHSLWAIGPDPRLIAWSAPVIVSLIFSLMVLRHVWRRRSNLRGVALTVAGIAICVAALTLLLIGRSRVFFI